MNDTFLQLQTIDSKLDSILSLLGQASARPVVGPSLSRAELPRGEALAKFDAKWDQVKANWPGFRVHPKACEAYERHVQTLGKEPSLEGLKKIAEKIGPGKAWTRARFEANLKYSYEKAQAVIYFMKIAQLGVFVAGRGLVVND